MVGDSSDHLKVIYPNRSSVDYGPALLLFLAALAIAIYLRLTDGAYPFGEGGIGLALAIPLVVLPVIAGGLWLAYALNTSLTVTSKGLMLRNFAGRASYIWWNNIYRLSWRQWHPLGLGLFELQYMDDFGRSREFSLGPRTRETSAQLRWLRDYIIEQCGLEKLQTHGSGGTGEVADRRAPHVWIRPEFESKPEGGWLKL